MRTLTVIIAVLVLLVIGGALTTILVGDGSLLPTIQQSNDPEASTLAAEGWQAEQFVLLVLFLVVNLVGIGVTIAGIMWVLSRGVKSAEVETALTEGDSSKS